MDVIFDIDGTLADASHRLHFIKDMKHWVQSPSNPEGVPKPDWVSFLSDEQVSKDAPITQTFQLMASMIECNHNIIFATGRNVTTYHATRDWILEGFKKVNGEPWFSLNPVEIFMRSKNDRRPSDQVKRDLLNQIREVGYNPTLVFEDRKEDTVMWRSEGLLCCQVAEGNY